MLWLPFKPPNRSNSCFGAERPSKKARTNSLHLAYRLTAPSSLTRWEGTPAARQKPGNRQTSPQERKCQDLILRSPFLGLRSPFLGLQSERRLLLEGSFPGGSCSPEKGANNQQGARKPAPAPFVFGLAWSRSVTEPPPARSWGRVAA